MKILFPLLVAVFLISCSDDSKTSSSKEEVLKQVNETVKVVSKKSEEVVQQVQKSAEVVVEQVKVAVKESEQKLKQSSAEVVSAVAHKTAEIAKEVEVQVKEATKPVVAVKPAIDGSKLFAKCVGCHGSHGERKALGKSQLIQAWSEEKTLAALHGYKDGTYGSSMKGVMKSQISSFSESELQAIAKHISSL